MSDVILKMAKQAFELSCGIKSEWARWSIQQRYVIEEIIEANVIFAIHSQNICQILKVIFLLREMQVIVVLTSKKTLRQCF